MENFLVEIGGLSVSLKLPVRSFQLEKSYLPFLVAATGEETSGWLVNRESIPRDLNSPSGANPPFPRWEVEAGGEEKIFRVRRRSDSPRLWKAARMAADLSRGEIWNAGSAEEILFPLRELGRLLFAHFLLPRRGLLLHGAAARISGSGYIFPALSGGGKSTWAELMNTNPNWSVIAEDQVIVRAINGELRIFGTPWNPRREFQKNASAPLKGIYFLHHGRENSIRGREAAEIIPGLLQQAFLPFPDPSDLEEALSLLETMAGEIPAYDFGFRPEISAINYFQAALKNSTAGPARRRILA
ncbi:MAG: hypothetical protein P9M08_11470 [Candidatus Erginobacter occultus]|nr:hypothetical protein [Candidatus Erginobacter occultus]